LNNYITWVFLFGVLTDAKGEIMPITITLPDQIFPDWVFWVLIGIVIINIIVIIVSIFFPVPEWRFPKI
jgi:hypothetical protein